MHKESATNVALDLKQFIQVASSIYVGFRT
jgi:hypothetical protein